MSEIKSEKWWVAFMSKEPWGRQTLMTKRCCVCVTLPESEQWDCMSSKSREQLQLSLSTLQSDSRPDLKDKAQELRRHIQSQPWTHTHAARQGKKKSSFLHYQSKPHRNLFRQLRCRFLDHSHSSLNNLLYPLALPVSFLQVIPYKPSDWPSFVAEGAWIRSTKRPRWRPTPSLKIRFRVVKAIMF